MLTLKTARSAQLVPVHNVFFDLARPADDADLRDLLRATPMEGAIDVAFLREPSYFAAARIAGTTVQTLVARPRERHEGRIAGVGTRALRRAFVNGVEEEIGYLGDLRLRPEFRGGTVLARGYRFLEELHADGRARLYTTVIVNGNETALRTIAAGRAGLPLYTDLGTVLTPFIHVRRRRRAPVEARAAATSGRARIVRGSREALPRIVKRLNEERLQFSPVYTPADFLSGRFPGLRIEDFYLLLRGDRLAGVLAVWDQRSFRQTVAVRYHGLLRWARPLSWLTGGVALPPPGRPLDLFSVGFIATDDVEAFRALLARVHADSRCGPWIGFTVGLHERDPRAAVFEEYRRMSFGGRLFAVTFDGPPRLVDELDGRVPYVEASCL